MSKKELKEYKELTELKTRDLSALLDEDDEYYKMFIKKAEKELAEHNKKVKLINEFDVLKQKFITMFCSGLYTKRQIADILKVQLKTINEWLCQEDVIQAIEDYQMKEDKIISAQLKALRSKALDKADELLDSKNDMVKAIIIRDILDRTGHKPVDKQEIKIEASYEERLKQLIDGVDVVVYDVEDENLSK